MTTLHKGHLFWLSVLALVTATASLAIRGALASVLKAEWIDPIAPLQAGELAGAAKLAVEDAAASLSFQRPEILPVVLLGVFGFIWLHERGKSRSALAGEAA